MQQWGTLAPYRLMSPDEIFNDDKLRKNSFTCIYRHHATDSRQESQKNNQGSDVTGLKVEDSVENIEGNKENQPPGREYNH